MKFGKYLASALVASTLVATPIAVQAAAPARASSDVRGENFRGGFIIPLLALAAVIAGLVILLDEDNGTLPKSP